MDTYTYPDSGSSSPRSRDIDPSDSSSFFDDSASSANYKLKFMVSYGGKIQPRLHDNHLTYLGGETKLLTVDRHISLPALLSRLSSLSPDIPTHVSSFKYQLPGEDLDSLISVSSEDDQLHLFLEYDRLIRSSTSSKTPRMRLFLFPPSSSSSAQQPPVQSPECDRFIDALNSIPSAPQDSRKEDPRSDRGGGGVDNNVDFLLGFEKGMLGAGFRQDPVRSEREVAADRGLDPIDVQRQLQLELQRMQLRGDGQDSFVYGGKIEDSMNVGGGGIGGYGLPIDFYTPKITEKTAPPTAPLQQALQPPTAAVPGYWQEKQAPTMDFFATGVPEQQMYVIPGHPAGGIYHPPPPQAQMVRPVGGHGFYAVPQKLPPDIYRDHQPPLPQQQMYSILPQQALSFGHPPSIQSQAQFPKAGETVRMVRSTAAGGGVVDTMNCGQGMYVGPAGVGTMVPSPYQGMPAFSGAGTRVIGSSGGFIQEFKDVGKANQNQNSI